MTTQVTCKCGAIYERSTSKLPVRDKDSYECAVCGKTLESWNSSTIPEFRLVERPEK
jgi:transposase-like protein